MLCSVFLHPALSLLLLAGLGYLVFFPQTIKKTKTSRRSETQNRVKRKIRVLKREKKMFFTQQELELLNSWPKSAVGAKRFSCLLQRNRKSRTLILKVSVRKLNRKAFWCSVLSLQVLKLTVSMLLFRI